MYTNASAFEVNGVKLLLSLLLSVNIPAMSVISSDLSLSDIERSTMKTNHNFIKTSPSDRSSIVSVSSSTFASSAIEAYSNHNSYQYT